MTSEGARGDTGGPREARLRPEFAARYPYLMPGAWAPAAVLSDKVVAALLGRPGWPVHQPRPGPGSGPFRLPEERSQTASQTPTA
jgi:hypothetical protein